MNVFEFVIAIIIVTGIFSLVRARMGLPPDIPADGSELAAKNQDNDRLRQQVQQLQDRIKVLERIVTDSGVQTAAQIEALRERDAIAEEDQA